MNNMSKLLVGAAVAALVGAVTITAPAKANEKAEKAGKKGCGGKKDKKGKGCGGEKGCGGHKEGHEHEEEHKK